MISAPRFRGTIPANRLPFNEDLSFDAKPRFVRYRQ